VTVNAYQIPPDQVLFYWDTVFPWLEAAYAKTDIPTPESLLADLASGHKQLWVAYAEPPDNRILCAVLTRLAKMLGGLHCEVVAAGGREITRWIHLMSSIEDWARLEGCVKVTVIGRPAWLRVLRNYRQRHVMLELEL
jgi:hypothetical protein